MAIDMQQVRAALEPEEPDYPGAAQKLGVEALPFLEQVITGDHASLAAKAAYLAGLIGTDAAMPAMQKAAASGQAVVRIAAASAARHLPDEYRDAVVLQLVDDGDQGVRKLAMRSAPAANVMSDALKSRMAAWTPAATPAAKKAAPAAKKAAATVKKAAVKKAAKKKAPKKKP